MDCCLLCLEFNKELLNFIEANSKRWQELNITKVLEKHFWPLNTMNPSSWMCLSCWQKLDDFNRFYLSIEEAHCNLGKIKVEENLLVPKEKILSQENENFTYCFLEQEILIDQNELAVSIVDKESSSKRKSNKSLDENNILKKDPLAKVKVTKPRNVKKLKTITLTETNLPGQNEEGPKIKSEPADISTNDGSDSMYDDEYKDDEPCTTSSESAKNKKLNKKCSPHQPPNQTLHHEPTSQPTMSKANQQKHGPPSRSEGKKRFERLSQEAGLDDKSIESASLQLLSWKDDEAYVDSLTSLPVASPDPSPFTLSDPSTSLGAVQKTFRANTKSSKKTGVSPSLSRSSSELSCITPLQTAAQDYVGASGGAGPIKDLSFPSDSTIGQTDQKDTVAWAQIVETMKITDLMTNFFSQGRNVNLHREVTQFISQYEVVACFSIMNYLKDGLLSGNLASADASLAAFISGFTTGLNHANQVSLEKSIFSLDVLIKQTQHFIDAQRDTMETLHQNTDVLQQNIQRNISEMSKLREIPDKISDFMESTRSQYETSRSVPSFKLAAPSIPQQVVQQELPNPTESVIIMIKDIPVKIIKESPSQERVLRMNSKVKSYFEERPNIVTKLKTLPWSVIQSCQGKDMAIYFPDA